MIVFGGLVCPEMGLEFLELTGSQLEFCLLTGGLELESWQTSKACM